MRKPVILPFFIAPEACRPACTACHALAGCTEGPSSSISVSALDDLLQERMEALSDSAAVELAFYGDLLSLGEQRWQEVLRRTASFVDGRRIIGIRVATRPDRISERSIEAMLKARVQTVELDLPSLSEPVLEQMGPAHGAEQARRSVAELQAVGFKVGLQVRPGLPESTLEREVLSIDEIIALAPDFVRLHPVLVLRGTWLERYFQTGRYVPMTQDECVRTCRLLVDRLSQACIPVARIGLQPVRDFGLEPGCVVGGPYHPSLRTLIEAERMYDRAAGLVGQKLRPGRHVIFYVSPESESNLRGPENSNLSRLRKRYHLASVGVSVDRGLSREILRVEFSLEKRQCRQRFAS